MKHSNQRLVFGLLANYCRGVIHFVPVLVVMLGLGLVATECVQAAPITFSFTGTVTVSDFSTIPVGSAVTGHYTFDSGLTDTNPNPFNGDYGPVAMTITFSDGSSVITSTATFFINNNSSGIGTTDEYSVRMDTAPDTLTGSFAALRWEFGRLERFDATGTAFSNDSLPLTPPNLASLPGDQSKVSFDTFTFEMRVAFELTSLSLFQPDADGDGVPDNVDQCTHSDLSTTVVIDGCNSGVTNTLFATGCTIADLIAECADGASNHGQFVRCVSKSGHTTLAQ
jgi:hypothetical protein